MFSAMYMPGLVKFRGMFLLLESPHKRREAFLSERMLFQIADLEHERLVERSLTVEVTELEDRFRCKYFKIFFCLEVNLSLATAIRISLISLTEKTTSVC